MPVDAVSSEAAAGTCDLLAGGSGGGGARPDACAASLAGLGAELLAAGQVEAAAGLARQALAAQPRSRPAWLLLARVFVAARQYGAALVALNVVPTPPLPAAEVELLHVAPPLPPRSTTQPQVRGSRCTV